MGIFDKFNDFVWLSECEILILEYAPQTTTAKAFCEQNKEYLLGARSMRKSPNEALIDLCILFTNAIAEGKVDTSPYMAQEHMVVAYQTGFGFLNRWPNIKIDNDYAVRMFRVMERIDTKIWQSPLAKAMSAILEEDARRFGA